MPEARFKTARACRRWILSPMRPPFCNSGWLGTSLRPGINASKRSVLGQDGRHARTAVRSGLRGSMETWAHGRPSLGPPVIGRRVPQRAAIPLGRGVAAARRDTRLSNIVCDRKSARSSRATTT